MRKPVQNYVYIVRRCVVAGASHRPRPLANSMDTPIKGRPITISVLELQKSSKVKYTFKDRKDHKWLQAWNISVHNF